MSRTVTIVTGASTTVTLEPGQVSPLGDDDGVALTDDAGVVLTEHPAAVHSTSVTITEER